MSVHSSEGGFEGSSSPKPASESNESATVCFLCRQRKTKCDRRKTGCSNCKAKGVKCQYIPTPRKHGLRAGYVSELERRIASLEREVSGLKSGSFQTSSHPSALDTLLAAASSNELSVGPPLLDDFNHVQPESPAEVVHDGETVQLQSPPYHGPSLGSPLEDSFPEPLEEDFINPASLATWTDDWFREYHRWLPILRKDEVLLSLSDMSQSGTLLNDLILKSIAAITIGHARQVIALGYERRWNLANRLRQEVIMEAMSKTSLKALQALCIILVLDYGYGRITEFWSLMAIAKGMVVQLELQNYVRPRQEQVVNSTEREEILLATWSCRALADAANPGPCWADNPTAPNASASDAMIFASQNPLQYIMQSGIVSEDESSPSYADFVKLVSYGISPMRQPISRAPQAAGLHQRIQSERSSCESVFAIVMKLSEDCAPLNSPLESYKTNHEGHVFFDPNVVMTRVAFHTAIVNYVGKFVWESPSPGDTDMNNSSGDRSPWQAGLTRCLSSTRYIAQMIKELSDWDIEFISPLFIQFIFVAARFFLVYSRRMSARRTVDFDLLMHAINMCGRRWPLARRLEIVLRAVVAEEAGAGVGAAESCVVPEEFFDLRIQASDLQAALKTWVEGLSFPKSQEAFTLAGMSGPYA